MAVAKEENHTSLALQDTLILCADTKDEIQIGRVIRPFIPLAEISLYDLVSAHCKSGISRNVIREVRANKINVIVRDLLHHLDTVPLHYFVHNLVRYRTFCILAHKTKIRK